MLRVTEKSVTDQHDKQMAFMEYCILCLTHNKNLVMSSLISLE